MKRSLLLIGLFLAVVGLLVAPTRASSDARAVGDATPGYVPVAELLDPGGSLLSVRDVAVVDDFAHVVLREGKLATYDISALQDEPPTPGGPLVSLSDPVSELDMPSFGNGLLANDSLGYAYGTGGVRVLQNLGTGNVAMSAPFSDRHTVNLIQYDDVLIGVGLLNVTVYSLADPALPIEESSTSLGTGNMGFSAAVVQDSTVLVGQFASGAGGTSGIAVFDYAYPDLTPVTLISEVPVPYHLHALGSQVVSCHDTTIKLWDFSFPANAVQDDEFQSGGRVCARDGQRIVSNGAVLNVEADALAFVASFTPGGGQVDGWPYGSDVADPFIFLAQSSRVLLLTRPSPLIVLAAEAVPIMDGSIKLGEWGSDDTIPFEQGFIAARNDAERLYLLINMLGDGIPDVGDEINVSFDVDKDGAITPGVDINYHVLPETKNMRPRYYASSETFGNDFTVFRSGRAEGFGCSPVDGSLFQEQQVGLICNKHVVWEVAFDLAEIGAEPGDSVYMGIGIASGFPQFHAELPANYLYEFNNLIQVELADIFELLPPDTGPAVPFQANPLEVTQAVQTRDNALPLVADKDTTVRAYLNNTSGSSAWLAVHLYGSRGGVDLPGSPLTVGFTAPTAVDRDRLAHTANFDLPASWVNAGTVELYAEAKRWLGASSTSGTVSVNFQTRDTPLVWNFPVNQGTAGSPSLQSAADMADAREYMETVYPVPDITYVNGTWSALGANMPNDDALIAELNDYHGTVVLAWIFGFLFSGSSPFDLPDQIHGFTPTSDGLSDPTWYNNGNGYVSYSGDIADGDLIMGHEINHNLDRSATGTWGRHNGGCGSTGPDPSWPYANDDVNEVGFDARTPWVDGVVSDRRTVITTDYPDFMSYCTHANMPGAWISPYRWNNLFAAFAPPSMHDPSLGPEADAVNPATRRMLEAAGTIQEVLYLSGRLGVSGDGELDPVLVEQGLPTADPTGSTYTIEIRGGGGVLLDSLSFDMSFVDVEGNPITEVFFSFRVPVPGAVTSVQLKQGATVLAEIAVSQNTPQVAIQEPSGGEVWSGTGSVSWTANDGDDDDLQFTLLYSPDDGATWQPIASGLTGLSYEVDATQLPGGTAGKVRVLATDDYNTTSADSSGTFTVPNQPPLASIDLPVQGAYLPSGEFVTLQASAQDPEGDPLDDENFIWKIDGQIVGIGADTAIFLSAGRYTIVLEVADNQENLTSLSTSVTIGINDLFMPVMFRE